MSKIVKNSEQRITQNFNEHHEGIDIGYSIFEEENKVFPFNNGEVTIIVDGKNNNKGSTGIESYGNFIVIKHEDNLETTYAHLQKNSIKVKPGDKVTKEISIATIGDSGNAFGRHLHFKMKKNGVIINPLPYLKEKIVLEKKKSNEEIAIEVIEGKWGNGKERKEKLINNGYNYNEIQKIVNEKMKKQSIEDIAIEVIQGKWGNGIERKQRLTSSGYDYLTVQKRVNELLK